MKITYINEGVRLPSNKQQKINIKDIKTVNSRYIKQQIISTINECFSSDIKVIHSMLDADILVPWIEEDEKFDFSPAILKINDTDDNGSYEITLGLYVMNSWQNYPKDDIESISIWAKHINFYKTVQNIVTKCSVPTKFKFLYYPIKKDELSDILMIQNDKSAFERYLRLCSTKTSQINQLVLSIHDQYDFLDAEYIKFWVEYVKMIANPLSTDLQLNVPIYDSRDISNVHTACTDAGVKCSHIYVTNISTYIKNTDIYTWMHCIQQITDIATDKTDFYISLPISTVENYVENSMNKYPVPTAYQHMNILRAFYGILRALRNMNILDKTEHLFSRLLYFPEKSKFYVVAKNMHIDLYDMSKDILQKYNSLNDEYKELKWKQYIYNWVQEALAKFDIISQDKVHTKNH